MRLDENIPNEKELLDILQSRDVPMRAVGSGDDAFLVDVKDVILLGTKESLELVVIKFIHGYV
jgi:hypothetical protein